MNPNDIAKYIDQTILKPDATQDDIHDFLKDVAEYRFACAVVNPCWVPLARAELTPDIKVCSVVGFPLGACSTNVKAYAAEQLIRAGCDEIDMVMNIGRFRGKDYEYVGDDIKSVVKAAQDHTVKVIIETALLNDKEKRIACEIILENKAHFVKTSTGFSTSGATVYDVGLIRAVVGPEFGVKASGGIRDYAFAMALLKAGANRLGTSAGKTIVDQVPAP